MTNNGTGKMGSFGNVVYDSGNDTPTGRKRIGISATEIELFDDIPSKAGMGLTSVTDRARGFGTQLSSTSKQNQQNSYQILSSNRESSKPNVIYQDENNQQLNRAVDQLLEKYAPDAIPQNVSNTRRVPPQAGVMTGYDQPPVSTFQTIAPPPASLPATTTSNNYSTIIRPNSGQKPQLQTPIQTNNNNNNNSNVRNGQTSIHSRPTSNYDSFQHVVPPVQQQQQPQPQASIPIKTKNGNFTKVVPGKLYTLDDDPLHLLYDRQNTVPNNAQQSSFRSTFQPTSQPSTVLYTNASQGYPQQPITLTAYPNPNSGETFDLGNLIKRVQQDYLREVQPYVSSVKFVEKDREYGQSLADVGFITPVSVRKGFTRQADDILRRSFGRETDARPKPRPSDPDDENTYSEGEDDDLNELHASPRKHPLEQADSKNSFTSVTSASTGTSNSDVDARYTSLNKPKNPIQVHNQGTSPPPQVKQTKPQINIPPATTLDVPSKSTAKHETDDEEDETTTVSPAPVVKLAKRISPGQESDTSSGSTISDSEQQPSATYNEHERLQKSAQNPPDVAQALAAVTPIIKADETTRQRFSNVENRAPQRSEDIHPTPPLTHTSLLAPTVPANSRTQVKAQKEESDREGSGSDNSESEGEDRSAAYNEQPQAPSSTARSRAPQVTTNTSATRGPLPTREDARTSATTAENPAARSRVNTDNNARQQTALGTNPNIHFVPTGQRSGLPPSTTQPTTTTEPAQTGSNRFFKSDNVPKSGGRRSMKDGPASIGDRLKSLFRRK